MKTKKALLRSAIIIIILLLSAGIGLVCQVIGHRMDLKKYPRPDDYKGFVEKYSDSYEHVPEQIVYGVIKYVSDFSPSHVSENGGIGLMGITPEVYEVLTAEMKEEPSLDSLYGPETNIKYGTRYLSDLFNVYGRWDQVFAAVVAGRETVDGWRENPSLLDGNGKLKIPDKSVASKVKEISKIVEKYKKLYY